jgi:hypothetical protein
MKYIVVCSTCMYLCHVHGAYTTPTEQSIKMIQGRLRRRFPELRIRINIEPATVSRSGLNTEVIRSRNQDRRDKQRAQYLALYQEADRYRKRADFFNAFLTALEIAQLTANKNIVHIALDARFMLIVILQEVKIAQLFQLFPLVMSLCPLQNIQALAEGKMRDFLQNYQNEVRLPVSQEMLKELLKHCRDVRLRQQVLYLLGCCLHAQGDGLSVIQAIN